MRSMLSFSELPQRINPYVYTSASAESFTLQFDSGDSFFFENGVVSYASSTTPGPVVINPNNLAQIIQLTPAQIGQLLQRMDTIRARIDELNVQLGQVHDELLILFESIATIEQQLEDNPNHPNKAQLSQRLDLLKQKRDAFLSQYVNIVDELNTLTNEYNDIVDLLNWSGDWQISHTHLLPPVYNLDLYNLGYPLVWS